ncbi:nickel-dependent lactate racemase [Gelria sp. Kuro-4]|uniref:nickel-dependent lactate racemase n=1 Tax=Gelria sp. Kuro-4 TaxID=2796927 RepID=UPI001BF10DBE|nr:nickel-dependent lactate racemase [Gelria sp. Kuro-4]BCV24169.1 hypothetical protein kuro4_09420 [Gelria sp. Kuro-4]
MTADLEMYFPALQQSVIIPQHQIQWIIRPQKYCHVRDSQALVRAALAAPNPYGLELTNVVRRKEVERRRTVIVIDDVTRPTPVRLILPELLSQLSSAGVSLDDIILLVATGSHAPVAEPQLVGRIGADVFAAVNVVQHKSRETKDLVKVGSIGDGMPLVLNQYYMEADIKIALGNVVPHVNVGWGGGCKAIVPGISGQETIDHLHFTAAKHVPRFLGQLDNPIRREVEEAALTTSLDYIVNTVVDFSGNLVSVHAGHPLAAHKQAVEVARTLMCPQVKGTCDIVVVDAYPMDQDFWQASKALTTATRLVKPGGKIVLLARCPEGIGTGHDDLMQIARYTPAEMDMLVEKGDIMPTAEVAVAREVAQDREKAEILICSRGLTREMVKSLGLSKISSLSAALSSSAFSRSTIGIMFRGGEIAPVVVE